MKKAVTWFVLADGARLRIVASEPSSSDLRIVVEQDDAKAKLPSREINADRPGRTFDSGGEGRHAYEPPTDPHRKEKADFVRGVAEILEQGAHKNAFDRLVLVAPPKALGDLRGFLSKTVSGRVSSEIAKDYLDVPLNELRDRLRDQA